MKVLMVAKLQKKYVRVPNIKILLKTMYSKRILYGWDNSEIELNLLTGLVRKPLLFYIKLNCIIYIFHPLLQTESFINIIFLIGIFEY